MTDHKDYLKEMPKSTKGGGSHTSHNKITSNFPVSNRATLLEWTFQVAKLVSCVCQGQEVKNRAKECHPLNVKSGSANILGTSSESAHHLLNICNKGPLCHLRRAFLKLKVSTVCAGEP